MNSDFTDDMLRQALMEAELYEAGLYKERGIGHVFSAEFNDKMGRLIRKERAVATRRRPAMRFRRVLAFCAVLILILASAMSVSALRRAVFEFVSEIHEKYTHIFFKSDEDLKTLYDGSDICIPSYIPEGFELVAEQNSYPIMRVYEKGEDYIAYQQCMIENLSIDINTEGVELEELEFGEHEANYFVNCGVQCLFWYDNNYFYIVSTTLDRETLFKISESLEWLNN